MIIKSVTRKQASFGQLMDYLERGRPDERFRFHHNLYSHRREAVQEEFEHNAQHLKQRQGGVFLYHEILSIKKAQKLSELRQKELLFEIAKNYLLSRAPRSLAYGVLHDDKSEHLHYHLMISANEVGSSERIRLSRSQFAEIKKQLEAWVLECYPELEQTRVMGKAASGEKLSRAGGELKRRTGQMPERDDLKDRLKGIFRLAEDRGDFFTRLERAQVKVYVRGQSIGFEDLKTGRKHRLKTLGLEGEFAEVNARLSRSEQPQAQQTRPEPHERAPPHQEPPQSTSRPVTGMTEEAIQAAQERLAKEARVHPSHEAKKRARSAQTRPEGHSSTERSDRSRPRQEARGEPGTDANSNVHVETQTHAPSDAFIGEEALDAWQREAEQKQHGQQGQRKGQKEPAQAQERPSEPIEALQAAIDRRRRDAERFRAGQGADGMESTAEHRRDPDPRKR